MRRPRYLGATVLITLGYHKVFHAKMRTIKDRKGKDLTEAEDIKRGGKNTQKNCTKKIFTTQIIMMVSFHSNPKEKQCQRKLRLPHNFTHLTR